MPKEHYMLTTQHRHDKANIPEATLKQVISNEKQAMQAKTSMEHANHRLIGPDRRTQHRMQLYMTNSVG